MEGIGKIPWEVGSTKKGRRGDHSGIEFFVQYDISNVLIHIKQL